MNKDEKITNWFYINELQYNINNKNKVMNFKITQLLGKVTF
jgi:hypothetical protein